MIHDQFIRQSVSDVSLLDLLVDHRVHDARAAVDAERKGHLLVHSVEVRVPHLVHELAYPYYAGLLANRET